MILMVFHRKNILMMNKMMMMMSLSRQQTVKQGDILKLGFQEVWFNKQKEPEKHYRELLMLFTPCIRLLQVPH